MLILPEALPSTAYTINFYSFYLTTPTVYCTGKFNAHPSTMRRFVMVKRVALERLSREGADDDILGLIELLNSSEDYFTTSSCAGRIILLCIPWIGAKREAKFVAKWHRKVSKEEVLKAIAVWKEDEREEKREREKKDPDGEGGDELWLSSQSPILHVACASMDKAKQLLNMAIESGFKYSGIKSVSEWRMMVEIMSTERMDVPLGRDGVLFCDDSYLDFIISKANLMLDRGRHKLKRLYNLLLLSSR